ncbi:proton-coupled amino acid transporter-like protein CG1139 isoform X2 [Ischnura elegans]|uniref:proton-coupled amino acid transporter-like protein CG1139 isoform X2 n=1 Tax=Ischnura elegans TaxID=197161 RepID=UPI001ED8A9DF|nr:proton-coupled amino acid transporter-like protein CG1139 isoform X2 [Ischnura elegans]
MFVNGGYLANMDSSTPPYSGTKESRPTSNGSLSVEKPEGDMNGSASPNPSSAPIFTVESAASRKEKMAADETAANGEYNPHENRIVDHPTTNMETLFHLLKGSLGTGILAMPLAFMHSGYILGIIGTIIIGLICTYCVHLLVKSQYELCRKRRVASLNYPETAEEALREGPPFMRACAPYAGHIVNTFLLVYQLGTCCVYIVFVSSNLKDVMDYYVNPLELRVYMVILLLPFILINWVRNLKLLAPFSTVANFITMVGFGITLFYVLAPASLGDHKGLPSIDSLQAVGNIADMPLFLGTVLFALEAIGVIMPLENNMKTPKSFGGPFGVLNWSMSLIITLYVALGFFGYLKYGAGTLDSITLNLPHEQILAQCVKIMLAFSIFITYGLQAYVADDIAWNIYLAPRMEKNSHKILWEYAVRTGLVLITFLLAVAIPSISLFISLFGALCLSALGIVFPAIIQTATFWNGKVVHGLPAVEDGVSADSNSYSWPRWKKIRMIVKNSLLIIFGLLGLVIGTYTSVSNIIAEFS